MRVIVTGSTGMIGEGVLLQCLENSEITEVLSVSRRSTGTVHPKLEEYLVSDFTKLSPSEEKLMGYDACFFCAGISSVGMSEQEYFWATYVTTIVFAKATDPNPNMTFVYVSGGGTDSSENGKMMWARVKGKTENHLAKLPFKQTFGLRIGFVKPVKGQKHVLSFYKYMDWLLPVVKVLLPFMYNSIAEVTNAMMHLTRHGYHQNIIYVNDIHRLSKEYLKEINKK
jgi:uncharacterized protein YbjT (DUF2867 family)